MASVPFAPDLIVEVTTVCDKSCPGCYAPNIVLRSTAEEAFAARPDAFLKPDTLAATFKAIVTEHGPALHAIAVRGGEPTRHPKLLELLRILRSDGDTVYLETHAGWLSSASKDLLAAYAASGVTIKISFDTMHDLSVADLRSATALLDAAGIKWMVAITEPDAGRFNAVRQTCEWVADEQILFQPKATTVDGLVRPTIGVVNVAGTLVTQLRARRTFTVASV